MIVSTASMRNSRTYIFSIIALLVSIAILTRINYRFALQNPGGTDFLVHWVGTRSFIIEGISPYSDEAALRIQEITYGRPAQAGEHQHRVVYPFYSQLIFAPFAFIPDFATARAVWMTFSEIAVIAIAFLSMRLTGWRPKIWLLPVYFIFCLLWYHGLRPLINGNAVIVVALLLVAALIAIRDRRDISAGIFLGLATFKPHLVIIPIIFVLLWAISHRRWSLFGWTIGSTIILIILGMAFIPNWLAQNIWEIIKFPDYNPVLTFGNAFQEWWPGIGTQLKWGLTIFLTVTLIVEWWLTRGKGFPQFLWTFCLTLAVSQWIGIATDPGNFILLLLPLVLIFSVWGERWAKGGDWIILSAMLIIFVGLWYLFLKTVEYGYQPQQNPIMFLPMPLLILAGLYWIRWWVLRTTRHILDSTRS